MHLIKDTFFKLVMCKKGLHLEFYRQVEKLFCKADVKKYLVDKIFLRTVLRHEMIHFTITKLNNN